MEPCCFTLSIRSSETILMLQQDYWLLPEGIEEVLPDSAEQLELLRRRLLDLFKSWGYQQVIPPMVDFLDSLLTGSGYDLDLQTFKLTDQPSGRLLGVRADMTPQIARMDAHHHQQDIPSRLCYLGTVLRARSTDIEISRSPMQVGAELYGHSGLESDLEAIQLMMEMLAVSGIIDVHLDLGHVGIYRALAKQAKLDQQQETELFAVLQRKGRTDLLELLAQYALPEPVRQMLFALSELNGNESVIEQARSVLIQAGEPVAQALTELESVCKALRRQFPVLPIHCDLAELRGYHYHTGMVFAALVPERGREIARGGRYDDIGHIFGQGRPATGFSADLKTLVSLQSMSEVVEENDSVYAPYVADTDLHERIRELRVAGRTVIRALPGQAGGAHELNCSYQLQKQGQHWEIVSVVV